MSSINIYVCDDNKHFLEMLAASIASICEEDDHRVSLRKFSDPGELLDNISSHVDILFLDVEMPDYNGFEVARTIISKQLTPKIIFITNHREYVQKAFEVQAYRYLYKPCAKQEIGSALSAAINDILDNETVCLKNPDTGLDEIVYLRDITHFEAMGALTIAYANNRNFLISKTLKQIEQMLGQHYFRCHKSFLVNIACIHSLSDNKLYLAGGTQVDVSVRKRAELKRKINSYVRQRSRYF